VKSIRLLVLTGLCLIPCLAQCSAEKPTDRLNVVVLVVDDLGQRDLGCYGSSFYETPNADRLASEGVMFSQAYAACPVCSPTRASLVTGLYPQRTGITDYIGAAQPDRWRRNTPHLPAPYSMQLALEQQTIAEFLKPAGYSTFFGGKWHLGDEGFFPEDQGFDVNRGGIARGGPYGGKRYFSPYGNPRLTDGPPGEHLPDRLAQEAVSFMEQNRDSPFLVWLPFYSVHTPLMAREDLKKKYQERREQREVRDVFADEPPRKVRMSQDHAVYAGMVEAMDQAIGRVLSGIERLGLKDNTLVILTSDNGGLSTSEGSPTSNMPLRAGKGWLYEGGIRVVSIVRLPRQVPAGTTCDAPIISMDYVPTILDFCNVETPQELKFDGQSLRPLLAGVAAEQFQRPLFWQYPHYGNQGGAPGAVALDGQWKLIEWFDDGKTELFDLENDLGETQNVAAEHPEIVEKLRKQLQAWQRDVGAKSSTPNAAYDPAKKNGRG
jgi:arylsulfatase A-like enzyme